jgi:hypothetical protein
LHSLVVASKQAESTLTADLGEDDGMFFFGEGSEIQRSLDAHYAMQSAVDQNELTAAAAFAAIQDDEDQKEAAFNAVSGKMEGEHHDFNNWWTQNLSDKQDEVDQNEADFDSSIAAETTRAGLAEAANAAAIAAETVRATAAEDANTAALDAHSAATIAAELVLTNALATQVAARKADSAAVQVDVDILSDVSSPAIAGSMREVIDGITAMEDQLKVDLQDVIDHHIATLDAQTAASLAAIAATQADEDQNELDSDTAIADEETRSIDAFDTIMDVQSKAMKDFNAYTAAVMFPQIAAFGDAYEQPDGTNLGQAWYWDEESQHPGLDLMTADSVEVGLGLHLMGDVYSAEGIPASYTDAATLAAGTLDGTMFYHSGTPTTDFPVSGKHYFCEAGAWYGSPFYTPPTTVDATAYFQAADAADVFLTSGSDDAATAVGHFDAIMGEYENIVISLATEGALMAAVLAHYGSDTHVEDIIMALEMIINPPLPTLMYRVTPTAGWGDETILIVDGQTILAPSGLGIGGNQSGEGPFNGYHEISADGTFQFELSDSYGDGAYTLDFLKSDGSTAVSKYQTSGTKYPATQAVQVEYSGTSLSVDGAPAMTYDPDTDSWS